MGKIKPMKVREIIRILNKHGFKFLRTGRHDVYYNEEKNITVPVPTSHGVISKGVIQSLIRQIGISREEFLS